jgi:O-antigen/teichoic acid export membrane protein
LSYRSIYTDELKNRLRNAAFNAKKTIFKAVYPNAIKQGLTGIGGFLSVRAALIIGSLYLSLNIIASYGITIQIIGIIEGIAGVYFSSYQPQVVQYRVYNDISTIKKIYLKSLFFMLFTYIICGLILVFMGNYFLSNFLGSKTLLLQRYYILLSLLVSWLTVNHILAANILVTKNEVLFFKPSLISGAFTIVILFFLLKYLKLGVLSLILAQGIVQASYQNWKWPYEVIKELGIDRRDFGSKG